MVNTCQCEYCMRFISYSNIKIHTLKWCIKNPNSERYKEQNKERICERCKCIYTLSKVGSTKRFCSKSCSNTRKLSESTKNKISSTLKSRYENKSAKLQFFCKVCGAPITASNKSGTCKLHYTMSEETREKLSKAGKKSAQIQKNNRRSKIEALFFEKIKKIFNDAESNKILVDGWDTDVFLPTQQIAIFWNGPCHYYPIYGQKNLNQTQNRDKIKKSLFEKAGYKVYIIKDVNEVYPKKIWKNKDKRTDIQLNLFLEFLGRRFESYPRQKK